MALNLVVMASGRGSNFSAIAGAITQGKIPHARMVGLICNRKDAPVLELAKKSSVPTHLIDDKALSKAEYEEKLADTLGKLSFDYLILAGYMKILGKNIIDQYPERILNIHPSLLPSFRGLRAQQQALDYGVRWTGCTVHFVTNELDGGPVLDQVVCPIQPGESLASLQERMLPLEHQLYVSVLARLATQHFKVVGPRVVWGGPRS